jgi:hypothetical protein
MISDACLEHEPVRPAPMEMRRTFFDALRRDLDRHDLDDASLERAVADALEHLEPDAARRKALAARLNAGNAAAELRRRIASNLCLPGPRAPLSMPVQVLERERPAVLPRLAGLRFITRRRRVGER